MKQLSDVVQNEFVKNTRFNTLKRKVNKLDQKIHDATTLIVVCLLMEKKPLSSKPNNGNFNFQLSFVWEAYLMAMVLPSLEKYL